MSNKTKIQNAIINANVPADLDIVVEEIWAICELGKDPFSLISNAFIYGLMKGGVIK